MENITKGKIWIEKKLLRHQEEERWRLELDPNELCSNEVEKEFGASDVLVGQTPEGRVTID